MGVGMGVKCLSITKVFEDSFVFLYKTIRCSLSFDFQSRRLGVVRVCVDVCVLMYVCGCMTWMMLLISGW